jgi:hypothetical protein
MVHASPFARSAILSFLLMAGVFAIPFDSVPGPGALGELANELSFPFLGLAIAGTFALSITGREARLTSSLALKIGLGIVAVIFVSWLVNAASIHGALVRERTGENKFLTSFLVILYGIAMAWMAEQIDERDYRRLLLRPIVWSATFCSAYALFELAGRSGPLQPIFTPIDHLIHARQADVVNAWNGSLNYKVLYGWDPRLRSVSFEPPAFGNFCGFAWPWVWFAAVTAQPERKLRGWASLALFTLVIVLAESRTGKMMLLAEVATLALLAFVYVRRDRGSEAAAVARFGLPAAAAIAAAGVLLYAVDNYSLFVAGVVGGDSVSDLSRLGLLMAATNIFLSHPLLGVGLGQFGFHVATSLPDWAYLSPEIAPMLYYPNGPWPVVYAIYARIAAELGIVGLLGWIGLWSGLAVLLVGAARDLAVDGRRWTVVHPMILTCVAVLVSGIASDTYRTPMIWMGLGLSCNAIRMARLQRRRGATTFKPVSATA